MWIYIYVGIRVHFKLLYFLEELTVPIFVCVGRWGRTAPSKSDAPSAAIQYCVLCFVQETSVNKQSRRWRISNCILPNNYERSLLINDQPDTADKKLTSQLDGHSRARVDRYIATPTCCKHAPANQYSITVIALLNYVKILLNPHGVPNLHSTKLAAVLSVTMKTNLSNLLN